MSALDDARRLIAASDRAQARYEYSAVTRQEVRRLRDAMRALVQAVGESEEQRRALAASLVEVAHWDGADAGASKCAAIARRALGSRDEVLG